MEKNIHEFWRDDGDVLSELVNKKGTCSSICLPWIFRFGWQAYSVHPLLLSSASIRTRKWIFLPKDATPNISVFREQRISRKTFFLWLHSLSILTLHEHNWIFLKDVGMPPKAHATQEKYFIWQSVGYQQRRAHQVRKKVIPRYAKYAVGTFGLYALMRWQPHAFQSSFFGPLSTAIHCSERDKMTAVTHWIACPVH